MPVPSNQTALTAIDIGTLTGYTAFETSVDAYDDVALATVDLWYLYQPAAEDTGLEAYGYGNGTTYIPHLTIYTGPASAPVQLANGDTSQSRPVQQDIQTFRATGEPILFKFAQHGGLGNPSPSLLTIRIARWQHEELADGDLFINDSSEGFPGIAMDPATAIPKRYALNYPAGEGQMVLQDGVVAVIDAFDVGGPVLYDVAATGLTVRATPTMPSTGYIDALGTNQIDTFWVVKQVGIANCLAVSFDEDGVVGTPVDLGSASMTTGVTPQADNSALYGILGTEIKKITNPGAVVTTFVTVDATFNFSCQPMMMTDDTLLVAYEKVGSDPYIKQFDLSGLLLRTFTLEAAVARTLERIFAADDDPLHFWIWWQTATLNHFQKIRVTDGVTVVDIERLKFQLSVSQTTALTGETVYSGADFSCVPVVLRIAGSGTGSTDPERRMRIFTLPFNENKRLFLRRFELFLEQGQGLIAGTGSAPLIMISLSRDGGFTWGQEHWVRAGGQGEYQKRSLINNLGSYRNGAIKIVVSDPVAWRLLAAFGEIEEGRH